MLKTYSEFFAYRPYGTNYVFFDLFYQSKMPTALFAINTELLKRVTTFYPLKNHTASKYSLLFLI
jgi:hypothetical protein